MVRSYLLMNLIQLFFSVLVSYRYYSNPRISATWWLKNSSTFLSMFPSQSGSTWNSAQPSFLQWRVNSKLSPVLLEIFAVLSTERLKYQTLARWWDEAFFNKNWILFFFFLVEFALWLKHHDPMTWSVTISFQIQSSSSFHLKFLADLHWSKKNT